MGYNEELRDSAVEKSIPEDNIFSYSSSILVLCEYSIWIRGIFYVSIIIIIIFFS